MILKVSNVALFGINWRDTREGWSDKERDGGQRKKHKMRKRVIEKE